MQNLKACVCRDYVVLKSKQVEVLKVSRQRLFCVVPYRLAIAMARAFVTMYQLLSFLFDHRGEDWCS